MKHNTVNISTLQLVSQHFNISTLQLVSQHSTFQHLLFVSTFQHFLYYTQTQHFNISISQHYNIQHVDSTFNVGESKSNITLPVWLPVDWNTIKNTRDQLGLYGVALLHNLVCLDPESRLKAVQTISHHYFGLSGNSC